MLAFLVSALFAVRHPPFFARHVARFYVNEWQIIGKEAAWCSRLPYCDGGWQDLSLSPSFRLSSSPSLAIASVLSSLFAPRCYLARNPMWAHPHLSNALMVIAKRAACTAKRWHQLLPIDVKSTRALRSWSNDFLFPLPLLRDSCSCL